MRRRKQHFVPRYDGATLTVLRYGWLVLPVIAAACDLKPVEIPLGDPVVVVHGVMRPDREYQFIVVEQSFSGTVDHRYGHGETIPTEGPPRLPIENAVVTVTNLDDPADTCGNPVRFEQHSDSPDITPFPGVYWSPRNCPTLRAGNRLAMYVETPSGDVVTGTTTLPGMREATLNALGEYYDFGLDTVIGFNRDRDILRVSVDPVSGRLLQIEIMRIGDLDIMSGVDVWPGAKLLADTMQVAVPGDLVDASGLSEGDDVFRAGRRYLMWVSVTDSNYYDFSRSRNNKYTGRGLINHLEGGFGVFGSLAGSSIGLRTTGTVDDEREGVYLLTGDIKGVSVDARLTVYTARSADVTEVSGFIDGDWFVLGTGVGGVKEWQPWQVEKREVNGVITGVGFQLIHYQPRPRGMGRIVLRGDFRAEGSFRFGVSDSLGISSNVLGSLIAQRP